MSKNFELLQEIGCDEDLFRTSDSDIATATLSAAVVASSLDVDNAERERVLRNASLPDVLVPVEDSPAAQSSHIVGSLEPTERAAATGLQSNSAMMSPPPGGTLLAATDVPVPPAELFVNGESLGAKEMKKDSHLAWNVKYAPGSIEARGYKGGKKATIESDDLFGPKHKRMDYEGERPICGGKAE